MALIERLKSRRVYIDSNIFIYAFESYPEFADCVDILRGLVDDEFEGVTSEIAFIEILPKPIHGGRADLADAYLNTMVGAAGLMLVPVGRDVILRAVTLRAAARLNSLDAIHIATALDTGCDVLLTGDLRLRTPPQLEAIYLRSRAP